MPPDIALTLGDAIHNFRASLDHLAMDLCLLKDESTDGVAFPFSKVALGLNKEIKGRHFKRAGAAAVDLLVRIGPHAEGNRALYGLHQLDIMDKHRLVLPLFHASRALDVRLEGPSGLLHMSEMEGAGDGWGISAQPGDTLTVGSFELIAAFERGQPHPFGGLRAIETLQYLARVVGGTIDAFQAVARGEELIMPLGRENFAASSDSRQRLVKSPLSYL